MKKQVLLVLMMLLPLVASADVVQINGIYYNLVAKAKTAEVVKGVDGFTYYGLVDIPETVEYNDLTYTVKSIADNAFESSNVVTVKISNTVTTIGKYAFRYCFNLTSVEIPNSVTSIGESAFWDCQKLTSVALPSSLTSIENETFLGCNNLNSLAISNGVTSIGHSAFKYCSSLTSLEIPNSVTSIGYEAFSGCTSLTTIEIPNSVTEISGSAFYGCSSLTTVTLGDHVQYIYDKAFAKCTNLTDVYCHATFPPSTTTTAFQDSYVDYATLHVPEISIPYYKAQAPWSDFGSFVVLSDEPEDELGTCDTPIIKFENGKLKFECETEGAEFVSEITDEDVKKHYTAEIDLTATYHISVYATATGYERSEAVNATLCWIGVEPQTEGITNEVSEVKALPVLIQAYGGDINVQGADDGTQISVYSVDGKQSGSAVSQHGTATVNTSLQPGSIGIVKIGEKSIKVVMK